MASKSDKLRKLKDKASKATMKGNYDDARDIYIRALHLSPKDLSLRQKLAEMHTRLGDKEAAVREYQSVAGSYAADGLLLKAIAISKVLLSVDPTHKETQETLAQLYTQRRSGFHKVSLPKAMSRAVKTRPQPSPNAIKNGANDVAEKVGESLAETSTPIAQVQLVKKSEYSLDDVEVVNEELLEDEFDEAALEASIEFDVEIDEVEVHTDELPPIPLFSELESSAFVTLTERMALLSIPKGEVVISEGESADSMYIIIQGEVEILRESDDGASVKLATLSDGAFFGEMALLSDAPRSASVIALEDTMLFEISSELMDEIIEEYPSVEDVMMRFHQNRLLSNLLKTSPLFLPFEKHDKIKLIEKFQSKRVGAGKVLITKERAGDALYLLLTGRCDVLSTDETGADVRLAELKDGDVFGEMSLLFRELTSASVRTTSACVVLRMVRQTFNELIMTHPQVLETLSTLSDKREAQNSTMLAPDEPMMNEFLL